MNEVIETRVEKIAQYLKATGTWKTRKQVAQEMGLSLRQVQSCLANIISADRYDSETKRMGRGGAMYYRLYDVKARKKVVRSKSKTDELWRLALFGEK